MTATLSIEIPEVSAEERSRVDDISANLATIRGKIAKAAERAGRDPSQIALMAVTKNVPAALIQKACSLGVRHIGENRVQEAAEKRQELTQRFPACDDTTWHMIGHLQSNKAKKALDHFDSIDSVDSVALAERLNREAQARGRRQKCLVEVNIGGEIGKSGLASTDLNSFLNAAASFSSLTFEGLLVIPPKSVAPEAARPFFRQARKLLETYKAQFSTAAPVLSMGMSDDFEVAIEEGATMVRIGTALFGARPAVAAR